MPEREIAATLINETDHELHYDTAQMIHGIMKQTPTATIPVGGLGVWKAESLESGMGIQGRVYYRIGDGRDELALFSFHNPFIGGNNYSAVCSDRFDAAASGDAGGKAQVTYTVREKTAA